MAGINFDSTIGLLKNAIQGAETTHAAYAHNIANVNTPNFHRSDVSFQDQLQAAAGMDGDGENLTLATTSSNDINARSGPDSFDPVVAVDDQSRMRQDGNNVDVDVEMAKLSKNADFSQTGAQFLRNQYAMLRQVVTE